MNKAELDEQNRRVTAEFLTRGGVVSGDYQGMPLLLLHHVGAKTGHARVNPMTYLAVNHGFAVFASNGGAAVNPNWYHNLLARPTVSVVVGTETFPVVARVATEAERERIWARQKAVNPLFAELERATTRQIPVVILDRTPAPRPELEPVPTPEPASGKDGDDRR